MDTLEPSVFDVIVASSGLVECLVASALVRAGKSVLLLDETDVYGVDHASFSLAGLLGSSDASTNPHARLGGPTAGPAQLPDGCELLPIAGPGTPHCLPILCTSSWPPSAVAAPGQHASKGYILDLAPKVIYQAEALVDVLVRTKAYHYIEFKAVDGSFILQGGALRPIPASRAHIFRDKNLGLAEKRALMAFLTACLDAAQGQGPLAPMLNPCEEPPPQQPHTPEEFRPLLNAHGLSGSLGDVVEYGIAMGSWTSNCQASHASAGTEAAPAPLSASAGLAALLLYAQSMGRFGAPGAFMAPTYGSGCIPEALVRHCAVKGATTALRQPLSGLVVGPRLEPSTMLLGQTADAGAAEQKQPDCSPSDEPSVARGVVVAATGHFVECREALVVRSSWVASLTGEGGANKARPRNQPVARCVAALDGPLVPGPAVCTLVIPPASPGVGNQHPVQGLQLSAAAAVVPTGQYLLYLSMAVAPDAATQDGAAQRLLQPALEALARLVADGGSAEGGGAQGPTATRAASGDGAAAGHAREETPSHTQQDQRPCVLWAHWYLQHMHWDPDPPLQSAGLPTNLVPCPGATPGLHGYTEEVDAARALLARHFPGVPWVLDPEPDSVDAGGGSHGTGPGTQGAPPPGAADDDDQDPAIDELTAALSSLAAVLPVDGVPPSSGVRL